MFVQVFKQEQFSFLSSVVLHEQNVSTLVILSYQATSRKKLDLDYKSKYKSDN